MSTLLQSPWLKDLGWVLVHSLWQGAILWVLLALVFALGRAHLSAATKHRMAWLTMTALAFAPVFTMTWVQVGKHEEPQSSPPSSATSWLIASAPPTSPHSVAKSDSPSTSQPPTITPPRPTDGYTAAPSSTSWLTQFPIWFATAWLGGLVLLMIRLLIGWRWITGLKRTGVDPESTWRTRFVEWSERAMPRHTRVLVCPTLGVPLVVGWLRPVICFPASLLSRLSIAEVEALMLHELAHLKRHDPLLQFWVTVVETLLFHNPAAHALASTVRQTGELACDDLVLAWKGDGKTYARALAAAEEWRGAQFALAATGIGSLKHRIQRILGLGEHGRLTSLPERFGITSVAGIALYFVVCGLAVPRIARALTPEERIAVITQEREAMKVSLEKSDPTKLSAKGTVRTEDGSKLPVPFTMTAFSLRYSAMSTERDPNNVTLSGRGEYMTVATWIPGYAPASVEATPVAGKGKMTFDLTLPRGFPAIIQVVDADGKPVPGANITCQIALAPDRTMMYQGKLATDADGKCSPGNAASNQRFQLDVRAHGYQWQRFDACTFTEGKTLTLTLLKAQPVVGTILEAAGGKPVSGARLYCVNRSRAGGSINHGYQHTLAPEMSASPSDASGNVSLDVCHPDETYEVLLKAPGYGTLLLEVTGQSGPFKVTLKPGLTISGMLEDPDNELGPRPFGVNLEAENEPQGSDRELSDSGQFPMKDGRRVPFKFENLSAGTVKITSGFSSWKTDLTTSMEGIVLRQEKSRLTLISQNGESKAPAPVTKRMLRLSFKPPTDSPAFNGSVAITVNSRVEFYKATDNLIEVSIPVGSWYSVSSGGTTGFTMETKRGKMQDGAEPVHLTIPLTAAGAVSGEFRWMDGKSNGREPSLYLLKKQEGSRRSDKAWQNVYNDSGKLVRITDDASGFFISPAPLNETYKLLASQGSSVAQSAEFTLDNSHPLARQDIIFPKGTEVKGTVLQPDGTPMEGGAVILLCDTKGLRLSHSTEVGVGGRFTFSRVNFTVDGTYYLSVSPGGGCAGVMEPLTPDYTEVRLQRTKGRVFEGRLLSERGAPLAGVKLRLVPTARPESEPLALMRDHATPDAPSDADGKFRYSTLSEGTYTAYPEHPYEWADEKSSSHDEPAHQIVVPASGEAASREFRIKKREPKS